MSFSSTLKIGEVEFSVQPSMPGTQAYNLVQEGPDNLKLVLNNFSGYITIKMVQSELKKVTSEEDVDLLAKQLTDQQVNLNGATTIIKQEPPMTPTLFDTPEPPTPKDDEQSTVFSPFEKQTTERRKSGCNTDYASNTNDDLEDDFQETQDPYAFVDTYEMSVLTSSNFVDLVTPEKNADDGKENADDGKEKADDGTKKAVGGKKKAGKGNKK